MYVGDGLAKFVVVMLAADPGGGLLELFKQNLARAYSQPAKQRGLATIWPERSGTLVWATTLRGPQRHRPLRSRRLASGITATQGGGCSCGVVREPRGCVGRNFSSRQAPSGITAP